MEIIENYSLKRYNTFGIEGIARYFGRFTNEEELAELIERSGRHDMMFLGGGSNILFTKNYDGYVFRNEIMGIDVVKEDLEHIYVKAGAGENWHKLVMYCIERNLAGLENLSLIPGSVGASPMQNIGAYGVEIKDVFEQLEAYSIKDKKLFTFSHADCEFGYRESIFKNRYKSQFVITHVVFRLNKNPVYHTSYGAIQEELEKMNQDLSIQAISQAVINIRQSKLPDPAVIGNAGSFFKNPTVAGEDYLRLQHSYPTIPGYPQTDGRVKLAAGWMIEQAGWKGYRKGDAGCHEKQALVLVNYGNATGKEIYDLSSAIKESVHKKFGVELEREVNII